MRKIATFLYQSGVSEGVRYWWGTSSNILSISDGALFASIPRKSVHPSFFISEKVQVEAPELILGGNACNFIEILKYGKLEIGLRRDLRDFAGFFNFLLVYLGIKPGTLGSEGQRVISLATRTERGREKNFYKVINLPNFLTPWPSG